MDSCSLVIPTLSLPPPRIVTEGPRSSKNDQPNMNILRAESVPPKKTLSSSGTTTLSLLKPAEPAPPTLRRATSEPAKPMSRRVSLGPGCGMLDWIRLCKNSRDMAGTGGETLTVTEEELARHDTMSDAWTCIRGKVYNITPYFKFHPGGKADLLKAAGKDCTILFDEVHKWVNFESMLKKCYIGVMAAEPTRRRSRSESLNVPKQLIVPDGMNRQAVPKRFSESSDEAKVHSPQSPVHPPIQFNDETDSPAIVVVPPSPIRKNSDASRPVVTLWDWNQSEELISIQVFIHNQNNVTESDIVVDVSGNSFEASIKLGTWIYQMDIALHKPVKNPKVFIHSNKVDIRLTKEEPNLKWDNIGTLLPAHNQMVSEANREMKFRSCTISSIKNITHDTKLFTVAIPSSCHMSVPIGHHVSIRPNDLGNDLERSYTPVKPLAPTGSSEARTIELLIKLYKDGAMSQHLSKLSPGDKLRVSDPEGTFDATRLSTVTDVLLLAAGTGFTPMVRVLNQLSALPQASAKRDIHLMFANKTMKDMIWRNELETLEKSQKDLRVSHILSSPDKSWTGLTGRITPDLLKAHLPRAPSSEQDQKKVLVCVCGPLPFTTSISETLLDINYPEQCTHLFT